MASRPLADRPTMLRAVINSVDVAERRLLETHVDCLALLSLDLLRVSNLEHDLAGSPG
jgi:hypothetical protein